MNAEIMTPPNTPPPTDDGTAGVHSRADDARRHYDLALEHHRAGRLDVAIKEYSLALRFQPNSADTYNNLGVALRSAGRPEAAVACYRRSLALKTASTAVYTNLGNALRDLGDTSKAVEAHRRAVKHGPKSPKALYNAGLAFREGGHAQVAMEHFARAIKLEPSYAQCRVEHANTILQMGEWKRGFKELETRFAIKAQDVRREGIETWNGSSLQGKTILINAEGDEGRAVQFARFAAVLKRGGATVIWECAPHLAHLMAASPDIDKTVAIGEGVSADVQIPMLSLPARLGTQVDTVPEDVPYLNVPKVGATTLDIFPETRLALGLAWSGKWEGRSTQGPKKHGDMELDDLAELIGIPEIQVFSLERGAGASDISRLGLQPLVDQAGPTIMDLADMAATIHQLDLVVCCDSVAAHVAGALGKPVWMILDSGADWGWLLDREDSPWYPSMRIFRTKSDEPWSVAVSEVRKALMAILKGG